MPAPDTLERRIFQDPGLEATFRTDGFVVLPFLSEATADDLVEAFHALGAVTDEEAYHHDLWGLDRDRKDRAAALLDPVVGPALDAVLDRYAARTRAFILKRPGASTAVPPHVDISFVDERVWRSVMVWCSLTGHGEGDGILHIVPSSHRLRPGVRAHFDDASTFPDLIEAITTEWGVAVPVPKGHAVIFDHGTVHYAEPNLGTTDRLTLQCACMPQEAPLHYPMPSGAGRAVVLGVDEDFYRSFALDGRPSDELLARYRAVAEVSVPTERLRREHFEGSPSGRHGR